MSLSLADGLETITCQCADPFRGLLEPFDDVRRESEQVLCQLLETLSCLGPRADGCIAHLESVDPTVDFVECAGFARQELACLQDRDRQGYGFQFR